MTSAEPSVARIVGSLSHTRKYARLCEDTLTRVARWAVVRYPAEKDALKAAKTKLHQVYGAYTSGPDLRDLEARVRSLAGSTEDAVRPVSWEALQQHVSTVERAGFMKDLYPALFAGFPAPSSIADFCCGRHPFSIPWMPIDRTVRFHAYDIDRELVGCINDYFEALGRPRLAECRDLIAPVPDVTVDLAFILKSLPCLEQQEKGASRRILQEVNARRIVVSFPAFSLGGRSKEMYQHYGRFIRDAAEDLGALSELRYPNETFYLLDKPQSGY